MLNKIYWEVKSQIVIFSPMVIGITEYFGFDFLVWFFKVPQNIIKQVSSSNNESWFYYKIFKGINVLHFLNLPYLLRQEYNFRATYIHKRIEPSICEVDDKKLAKLSILYDYWAPLLYNIILNYILKWHFYFIIQNSMLDNIYTWESLNYIVVKENKSCPFPG
jgi:hypothetical protein